MWQEHHCSAYTRQLRNTPWVQTILRKMRCPPRPFDVWRAPVPQSTVQSPGFQHCREKARAKKRPGPKLAKTQAEKKATVEASSSGATVSSVWADTTSASSASAVAESSALAVSSVQRDTPSASSSSAVAESSVHAVCDTPSASSSSVVAVSSVPCDIPWPCTVCHKMPWWCRCHKAGESALEHIQQEYEWMCKRAGVWAVAQHQQEEAEQKAAQPEPAEEHPPRDLWSCWKCRSMNTKHNLVCCVASCGERRPITGWREDKGDWICSECQNHNWGSRRRCNWTACPTNYWRCTCGNLNRSNRAVCNRFVCGLPRPLHDD